MTQVLKVVRIGNSRGIRLPAKLLAHYRIRGTVRVEMREDGIVLKPASDKCLSWDDTFREMAEESKATGDEFADMEGTDTDGLERLDAGR